MAITEPTCRGIHRAAVGVLITAPFFDRVVSAISNAAWTTARRNNVRTIIDSTTGGAVGSRRAARRDAYGWQKRTAQSRALRSSNWSWHHRGVQHGGGSANNVEARGARSIASGVVVNGARWAARSSTGHPGIDDDGARRGVEVKVERAGAAMRSAGLGLDARRGYDRCER